jgi:4-hydroxybenzoate polyprenyltransferase
MEGHAVAEVCRRQGVPVHLLKGVSDRADEGGRGELHRNLAAVSAALAREAAESLAGLAPPLPGLGRRIANFVKVEHTIFSLPLLFAGAWLGAGGRWPGARPLGWILLAGIGARALGMAMNRLLDRRYDLLNPRTAGRELPSGKLSARQAWLVAGGGLGVYLAACAALGPVCLRLSPIPAAVLIGYSLLKRFTPLCHYGIGICLGLGPLGACVAVTGRTQVDAATVLLALFTFCWISGFDIIYAVLDLQADRELGVHSLPAALGRRAAQGVAALTHLVAAGAMVELWRLTGRGGASGAALLVMLAAFALAYVPAIPVAVRFFPISAVAGVAGAAVALLGR